MDVREQTLVEVWKALSAKEDEALNNVGGSYEYAAYASGVGHASDHVWSLISEDTQKAVNLEIQSAKKAEVPDVF